MCCSSRNFGVSDYIGSKLNVDLSCLFSINDQAGNLLSKTRARNVFLDCFRSYSVNRSQSVPIKDNYQNIEELTERSVLVSIFFIILALVEENYITCNILVKSCKILRRSCKRMHYSCIF